MDPLLETAAAESEKNDTVDNDSIDQHEIDHSTDEHGVTLKLHLTDGR